MAGTIEHLLEAFHGRTPLRAGSLIISIFGDAIAPRGGQLAMASLSAITRAFRLNDGLVRTAMSRLVADGWLERRKVGRNSYYRLTARGRRTFADATDRIYGETPRRWSGAFDLVVLDPRGDRAGQRAAFEARGYGTLTPDVVVAPAPVGPADLGAVRLSAIAASGSDAKDLARRAWPIRDLEDRYAGFVERFTPARALVEERGSLAELDALVLRILLVHEYRRIILRDPLLPPELLPSPWAGQTARRLCGRVYRAVAPAAERWLDAHACDHEGPLRPPDEEAERRFRDVA